MYAKIINNIVIKFPYTLGDLHVENYDTSFPASPTVDLLSEFNVFKIVETPAPTIDSKTHRQSKSIQQVDEVWTQVWVSIELPEDVAAANVRSYRDRLLT